MGGDGAGVIVVDGLLYLAFELLQRVPKDTFNLEKKLVTTYNGKRQTFDPQGVAAIKAVSLVQCNLKSGEARRMHMVLVSHNTYFSQSGADLGQRRQARATCLGKSLLGVAIPLVMIFIPITKSLTDLLVMVKVNIDP